MARSLDQVVESMQADIASIDPSIDSYAGPVRDLFVDPCATQVQGNEDDVQHLSLLYSAAFAALGSDVEINAFTNNYGIGRDQGAFAYTTQYFCGFSRPAAGTTIRIPQGTIVTTTDGFAFRTAATVIMEGDNADNYYNPVSRCYEVSARVNSVAVGEDFNTAAYTLVRMGVSIAGIDKTENRTAAVGGASAEASSDVILRAQAKMLGIETGTYGGILAATMNYNPLQTKDVALVFQSDWPVFLRREFRPALDVHVIGTLTGNETYSYTSPLGGETAIVLNKQPVIGVSSVTVNGTSVTFSLVADTNNATKGSTRALDRVQIGTPLSANDVVAVDYTYNSLLYDIQNNLFAEVETSSSRTRLFGTDVLIRGSIRVAVSVSVYVRVLASYDPLSVQADAADLVYRYVEPSTFAGVLLPDELKYFIESGVVGVSTVSIRRFTKTVAGDADVETIELNKNEEPYVDVANLVVDVSL